MEKIKELFSSSEPVKWLFTGDSITHGVLHTFGERDYVQIFAERIRYDLDRRRDHIIKSAVNGWTSQMILDDIEWNILQYNPDVVSIMIGMNDAHIGMDHIPTFKSNVNKMIDITRERTGAKVMLHTMNRIMPGLDPNREPVLPSLVDSIREIGREQGVPVIDNWAEWDRAWTENPLRQHFWMSDTIHPNPAGHRVFARLLMQELGIWDASRLSCSGVIP